MPGIASHCNDHVLERLFVEMTYLTLYCDHFPLLQTLSCCCRKPNWKHSYSYTLRLKDCSNKPISPVLPTYVWSIFLCLEVERSTIPITKICQGDNSSNRKWWNIINQKQNQPGVYGIIPDCGIARELGNHVSKSQVPSDRSYYRNYQLSENHKWLVGSRKQ